MMPLPCFSSFFMTDAIDLLGLAHLEVERVHVGGENTDIALAEIFQPVPAGGAGPEAEEWPDRLITESDADGGNALSISSLPSCSFSFDRSLCDQVMRADGMAGSRDLLHMISGCQPACLPIGKKTALRTVPAKALSTAGVSRPRTIVGRSRTTSWSRRSHKL